MDEALDRLEAKLEELRAAIDELVEGPAEEESWARW